MNWKALFLRHIESRAPPVGPRSFSDRARSGLLPPSHSGHGEAVHLQIIADHPRGPGAPSSSPMMMCWPLVMKPFLCRQMTVKVRIPVPRTGALGGPTLARHALSMMRCDDGKAPSRSSLRRRLAWRISPRRRSEHRPRSSERPRRPFVGDANECCLVCSRLHRYRDLWPPFRAVI